MILVSALTFTALVLWASARHPVETNASTNVLLNAQAVSLVSLLQTNAGVRVILAGKSLRELYARLTNPKISDSDFPTPTDEQIVHFLDNVAQEADELAKVWEDISKELITVKPDFQWIQNPGGKASPGSVWTATVRTVFLF